MKTLYRVASSFRLYIEKIENVERETEHYYWVRGRRSSKRACYETFEEARAEAERIAGLRLHQAELQLESAQQTLRQVRHLTEDRLGKTAMFL